MTLPDSPTELFLVIGGSALLVSLLALVVGIPWLIVASRRRLAERIGAAEADAARRAVAEQIRIEHMHATLLAALDQHSAALSQALQSLQFQTAPTPTIHDDTRKALVKLKQISDGIKALHTDMVQVNDEITNQSAAKFQANEIIRAALERGGPGAG